MSIAVPVVLPAERDFTVLELDQTVVGDSDPMGIAGKVVEHLFGTAEGRFSINNPFFTAAPS